MLQKWIIRFLVMTALGLVQRKVMGRSTGQGMVPMGRGPLWQRVLMSFFRR